MEHHRGVDISDTDLSGSRLPPIPRLCPKGSFAYRGVLFYSKSEAALATLLQRYVPDFRTMPGESFQVPIGGGKHVDFKINETLIEYHPIRPLHELSSRREYRDWRRDLHSRHGEARNAFLEETRETLAQRYTEKREWAIYQGQVYRNAELIVATSPREFFDKVISRFGRYDGSFDDFSREFSSLIEDVKRANRRTRYMPSRRRAA